MEQILNNFPAILAITLFAIVIIAFIIKAQIIFKKKESVMLENICKEKILGAEFTQIEFAQFVNKTLNDKASFKLLRKIYIEKMLKSGILKERVFLGIFNERAGLCVYTIT